MKVVLFVVVLCKFVIGEEYKIPSIEELSKNGIGLYNGDVKDNVNYYNEYDNKYELGNPDDDKQYIEKPCNNYDAFCIRRFFAQHSHCKESYGPVPTPLYRAQSISYLPRINLTVVSLKQEYTGVNGRVVEFYINKKTDKLVLAVEFTNFGLGSNENYFKFHRRGQEPIVNVGSLNVTYASIVSTIVIPHLKDLQYERSEVFTYNNDVNPRFSFGLSAFAGTDPVLLETALAFLASYADNIREGQLTDGPFFIASYIKYYICDFGIEVL